jgi:ABC-type Fe3+ transport system substrate-binding protein
MGRASLLAVASVLLLVACQAPAAPSQALPAGAARQVSAPEAASTTAAHSPEVERLLAAALEANERELNLAWPEATLGGHEGVRLFEELFNRAYELNVRVSFTPARMDALALKVAQESMAGQKASTDVLVGAEQVFASLVDRDVLEAYDYTRLAPYVVGELVAPRNVGIEVASRVSGISYNTDLVRAAEAPKRLEDVLHPRWKGRVASTPGATAFERVAERPEWGAERMKDFVGRLSQQVGGLILPGETGRVVSGEFALLALDSGGHQARKLAAKGAPLGHVIPEDGATLSFLYAGIPRNAAHPNLAKLFVNLLVSPQGQRAHYTLEFHDHHGLPGTLWAAEMGELQARGVRPLRVDVRFVLEHPEMRTLADELAKILRDPQSG